MSHEENQTNQYLTFYLNGEIFGIPIHRVLEVLDYTEITKVPQTPDYMRGVINLRGSIVPVVDMHLKFDLDPSERTVNSCIIIMDVTIEGTKTSLGALADSVREVIELEPGQIEPAPKMGTRLNSDFVQGMGKHGDEFIMLLNIDAVFTGHHGSLSEADSVAA
ncbi:MAG: chemotaxis protein CheW [Desulfuromonadaceae bacterium]|nr:chemotaxis protein CheW [Desulfuromonadaceae bacterium]